MKELWAAIIITDFGPFREPFKRRWHSLDHLRCTWGAPSGMSLGSLLQNTPWTLTVMTVSAFYLFWEFIFSLQKGKGNLFDDSIPNWGSHWSCVCACMCVYVYEIMCGCVCGCVRVWKEWLWLLSCSLVNSLEVIIFFLMPHCEDKHSYNYISFFHFPADNWVCCLCQQAGERWSTWCERATSTLHAQISSESKITFFLATVLRAPLCSVILFDWPSFDLDKKAWGSPLEVLCGYDVTSEYFLLFG